MSICSPNYLHDAHIRFGLRHGADVICEKPMVLNPKNIQPLIDIENETGSKVYHILQLRHHPSVLALKKKIDSDHSGKVYDIDLTYIASRGNSRLGSKDKKRFIQIAYSSCIEVLNHLLISQKLGFIDDKELMKYRIQINEITNKLNAFYKNVPENK